MKLKQITAAVALAAVAYSGSAVAAPMSGAITFGSPDSVTYLGVNSPGGATGIDFPTPITIGVGSGTFAGLSGFTATFTDIPSFAGFVPQTLWSLTDGTTTYTFSLNSLAVVAQTASFLNVEGAGTVSDGTDSALASFSFTGTGSLGTWTSETVVPLPGTAALLGLGLVGIAGAMRRRAA